MYLELKNITKVFPPRGNVAEVTAVRDVNLEIQKGELVTLLGPSGCGKTTTLRMIAGFEFPTAGTIILDGQEINSLPTHKRDMSMVFQSYAIFPHLTVFENIAYGLNVKKMDKKVIREKVHGVLELVHLEGFGDRAPGQLSGGQQQRVALARALAPKPRLLLLDEPFSNLDVELREKLSLEVRDILKQEGITALLVTHDQHEAFAMADQVGVMHEGVIQQWDTPYNLYHQPKNRFVADFVGQGALVSGEVINDHQVEIELGVLNGHIPVECDASGCDECVRSCHVDVLLRPDDIVHDDDSLLLAEVENKAFRGAEFLYTLKLPSGQRAVSLVPSHHNHAIGEKIGIKLAVDHVVAFRRE